MTPRQLSRTLFPLGSLTKTEVRSLARRFGLVTSDKGESQEICFVEDDSYGDFIGTSKRGAIAGGEIIDSNGKVLGTHDGLYRFTIGQRRGLNISDGSGPYYVKALDVKANRVVVGTEEELYSSGFTACGANWISNAPSRGEELTVKIRYGHNGAKCRIEDLSSKGTVRCSLSASQKSLTPGQAAVFYRGDEVAGGGWISEAL